MIGYMCGRLVHERRVQPHQWLSLLLRAGSGFHPPRNLLSCLPAGRDTQYEQLAWGRRGTRGKTNTTTTLPRLVYRFFLLLDVDFLLWGGCCGVVCCLASTAGSATKICPSCTRLCRENAERVLVFAFDRSPQDHQARSTQIQEHRKGTSRYLSLPSEGTLQLK